ncbi:MAG: hypothetical protein PHX04_05390 [Bacilli bacterium]|nr:hypothetical protein [Bacilli bacterium]
MRKLGAKNIRLFILFSIIVILVVTIFAIGIKKVLSYDKTIYQVSSGKYFYDKNYNSVFVKDNGTVSQWWDSNYYLKADNQKYNLGTETISFDPNDYRLYAYGSIFQTFVDGTVSKKSGQIEILNNASPSFYKLADRKYLMVDKEIIDENKDFHAKKFLFIILDKQGNALLLNDEINIKTLNSIILKSNNFIFDVALEKLNYNGNEINLKKIIGSTNEYKETFKLADKNSDSNKNINSNNNNNNDNNLSNFNNSINSNSSSNSNNSSNSKKTNYQKTVILNEINPSITFIDVGYSVFDPANIYESVFLLLYDGLITTKIQLNKEETKYRLFNLNPNQEYKVSLGYSYIDKDNGDNYVEEIQDIVSVMTKKANNSITITKVSANRIYFTLKVDPLYKLESGIIALYSDNTKLKSFEINTSLSVTKAGWESYIDVSNLGYEILLVLEDAKYNGDFVNDDTKTKYINY